MLKHVKTYLKYFGYIGNEFIPCEVCHFQVTDIHHIVFRSQGGNDDIENLIGLCRNCHDKAHFKSKPYLTKNELIQIHNAKI